MSERIYLRGFLLRWPDDPTRRSLPGVALPDGRCLIGSADMFGSYSSERQLLRRFPGAVVTWYAELDATLNQISEDVSTA